MEDPRTAPSLSPAEAEGFFATGSDARSAAPGMQPGFAPQLADGFAGASDLRCRECKQLRRSLPRHAAGCRYAYENCPGCAYAEQPHIASCPIATQLKLSTDDCCDGVDLPSIGPVHSPDCGNLRPVARASYTLSDDGPQAEAVVEDFPGLFGNLLFASRNLAMHWVLQPTGRLVKGFCLECGGTTGPDVSDHSGTCRVGRVLDLVAKICAVSPALATKGGVR